MDIPIIEKKTTDAIPVEVAAVFGATLFFVNGQGQATSMAFSTPPGLYPNPTWVVKLLEEAQREGLKALKLQTKDLSWRLPTPTEFVRMTSGNQVIQANSKYSDAYSVNLELEKETPTTNDNNSN